MLNIDHVENEISRIPGLFFDLPDRLDVQSGNRVASVIVAEFPVALPDAQSGPVPDRRYAHITKKQLRYHADTAVDGGSLTCDGFGVGPGVLTANQRGRGHETAGSRSATKAQSDHGIEWHAAYVDAGPAEKPLNDKLIEQFLDCLVQQQQPGSMR